MAKFKLKADYQPAGDQPQAIDKLITGLKNGQKYQVLLGVTGSGKTYTLAQVISRWQKPVLVISHNKTLAAQLYQEFKDYFPANGVGFFISYYDYYLPESYLPATDTYITKETEINEEIDKLRLQATSLLFSRKDVILVASVSCIYNLGSPLAYGQKILNFNIGQKISFKELLNQLINLYYFRTRLELVRSSFRVRGETIELVPAYTNEIIKISLENNQIRQISSRPYFSGKTSLLNNYRLYPAKHYLADQSQLKPVFAQIKADLKQQITRLEKQKKFFEAQRLGQRVKYDLEMIQQVGYVNGIENYSRYFDQRQPGDPPWTLIDYYRYLYQDNFLTIIDESHMSLPQIRGMYQGDLSRKQTLIDFGFRLPSCFDNRPLRFEEFKERLAPVIFASATPADQEIRWSKGQIIEQLVRPTGILDPEVFVRPAENQLTDLISEITKRKKLNQRVLITTLTKKLAEELAWWLSEITNTQIKLRVHYLHSEIITLERSDILADLRGGKYDVIVGVNLLREGLDLPEVSLVAILEADKQGFLRSKTSLIQTMGRAARHIDGQVILYADSPSKAMLEAIAEVNRRRQYQIEYNRKHGIVPQSIVKPIRERIVPKIAQKKPDFEALTPGEQKKLIPKLRQEMRQAARDLDFEKAANLRDLINQIEKN